MSDGYDAGKLEAEIERLQAENERLREALWRELGGKMPGCTCDPVDLYVCDGEVMRCNGAVAHWKKTGAKEAGSAWTGVKETCSACAGSGYYDTTGSPQCGACNGTGETDG